jgi:hypothetical protein
MRYSKGIMWLDDCRIPFVDETELDSVCKSDKTKIHYTKDTIWEESKIFNYKRTGGDTKGRFTPNLLVCDDMLNDGVITQYNKTREDKGNYLGGHRKEYVGTTDNDIVKQIKGQFFSDKGSNSRYYDLDKWFDKVIDSL